ncbi:MAG: HD domain-containing protein [Parachlamydiales bacterium]|nr:HD domain-containing protein [Parachlamydiales bacterium]
MIVLLLCLPCLLSAKLIDTFYGPIEVEEPLVLELIDSPAFQRLKEIHQYGVSYYTTHKEEYSRYDHSIGVFAVLRLKGASLNEQIAGLLHDVSHTAFSHVGDWIFGKEHKENDYQTSIHAHFLEESGLAAILNRYEISVDQILPEEELFPALECPLPNLCADRIDYNIQGAYYQGFITYEEGLAILNDLAFIDRRWVSSRPELIKKLTYFSLFMTQDCWGSPRNHLESRWLADAILRGIDLGCITLADIHFGTDQLIWDKLFSQDDPEIQKSMNRILHEGSCFSLTEDGPDLVIKPKFRGIDPWILVDSKWVRLTEFDDEVREKFAKTKQIIQNGWYVRL